MALSNSIKGPVSGVVKMRSKFLILCLLLLASCTSALPTSERLEAVKAEREGFYKQKVTLAGFDYGAPAFIRVFKQDAQLELWLKDSDSPQYSLYETYPICHFSGDLGPKLMEGDKQAPEGFYTVGADQMNPWSRHHLSFNLGYPNEYDQAWGRTGSALMIHGGCTSIGCYAVTDDLVEEIYLIVEASIEKGKNVPVHIFPFRMHAMNMYMYQDHLWMPYWQNLKQGYDAFEITKIPPKYAVEGGQSGPVYVFETPIKAKTNIF